MTRRSVNVARAAYLDTCVISGYVKSELIASERLAFEAIMSAYRTTGIDLLRSAVVDREIAAIPDRYRAPHETLLFTFLSIPVPTVGGLTRLGAAGLPAANPARLLWRRLADVLPDGTDRSHIFVAARNRVRFFITVDTRTVLSRRSSVLEASGVEPVMPSELVAHASSPMRAAQPVVAPAGEVSVDVIGRDMAISEIEAHLAELRSLYVEATSRQRLSVGKATNANASRSPLVRGVPVQQFERVNTA